MALSTQFACVASTNVHILTQTHAKRRARHARAAAVSGAAFGAAVGAAAVLVGPRCSTASEPQRDQTLKPLPPKSVTPPHTCLD